MSADYLTTGDMHRLSGLSRHFIIKCIDDGRLSSFTPPGSKHRRVLRAVFLAWLKTSGYPVPGETTFPVESQTSQSVTVYEKNWVPDIT